MKELLSIFGHRNSNVKNTLQNIFPKGYTENLILMMRKTLSIAKIKCAPLPIYH